MGIQNVFGINYGRQSQQSSSRSNENFSNRISPVFQPQQDFFGSLLNARMTGAGRFGYGGMLRQGLAGAENFLARRGINPRSGVAGRAIGGAIGDALINARQLGSAYDMQLAGNQLPYYQSGGRRSGYQQGQSSGSSFGISAGGRNV